jgi:hypothetical protein
MGILQNRGECIQICGGCITVTCTPCRRACFGVACLLQNVCITLRRIASQTDINVTLTAWQIQTLYCIFLSFFSLSLCNFCFRKTQKLILCKLSLEFLLSRCDTLIKLVISGLLQYTKAPKFWDFMLLPSSGGMMKKKTRCVLSLGRALLKPQI